MLGRMVPRRLATMLFEEATLLQSSGLTRKEAAIASQILKGDGLEDTARRLRVPPTIGLNERLPAGLCN